MLQTRRLTLVPLSVEEAHAILDGRRAEHYADGYPSDGTLVAAAIVVKTGGELTPWGMYQARVRATGRVVAGLGFIDPPDADGEVHIGFSETEEARADGYTAEAVEALIGFAREQGMTVVAETADPRAAAVFTEAGLEAAGVCSGLRRFRS